MPCWTTWPMRPGRTDFDGNLWPFTKMGLSLGHQNASLMVSAPDPGGIMPKFITILRDAALAVIELVGNATLPAPKRVPVKVGAKKSRR